MIHSPSPSAVDPQAPSAAGAVPTSPPGLVLQVEPAVIVSVATEIANSPEDVGSMSESGSERSVSPLVVDADDEAPLDGAHHRAHHHHGRRGHAEHHHPHHHQRRGSLFSILVSSARADAEALRRVLLAGPFHFGGGPPPPPGFDHPLHHGRRGRHGPEHGHDRGQRRHAGAASTLSVSLSFLQACADPPFSFVAAAEDVRSDASPPPLHHHRRPHRHPHHGHRGAPLRVLSPSDDACATADFGTVALLLSGADFVPGGDSAPPPPHDGFRHGWPPHPFGPQHSFGLHHSLGFGAHGRAHPFPPPPPPLAHGGPPPFELFGGRGRGGFGGRGRHGHHFFCDHPAGGRFRHRDVESVVPETDSATLRDSPSPSLSARFA